jgi:hypothetical protein
VKKILFFLSILSVACTTQQLERTGTDIAYGILDIPSPYEMDESAIYMGNVACVFYAVKYDKKNPPKNSFGKKLRTGHPYYSASSDWEFLPVDTIFEVDSKKFIIDEYANDLVGTKAINVFITHTNGLQNKMVGYDYQNIKILRWGNEQKSYNLLKARQDNNSFEELWINLTE